jgi:hypothetical protein
MASSGTTAVAKKKTAQQPPTRAVKIDELLVTRARVICADRGENLAEYFSAILRPTVEKDWLKVLRQLGDKAS